MESDFFKDVELQDVEMEFKGEMLTFKAPLRFFNSTSFTAVFSAPKKNLEKLLPSDKLKIDTFMGIAPIGVNCVEFTDVDFIGPYKEFSISIPVKYKSSEPSLDLLGVYCAYIGVDSELARAHGRKFYDFPKFIAETNFEDVGEVRRCVVRADGKDILTLSVKKLTPKKIRKEEMFTFNVLENQITRVRGVTERFGDIWRLSIFKMIPFLFKRKVLGRKREITKNSKASITFGDHPIAEELRALEMDEVPLGYDYSTEAKTLLDGFPEKYPM